MFSKVKSFSLVGLEGIVIDVEVDINKGLPSYDIVGLPDIAVKESKERVRSAIKNAGFNFPTNKITLIESVSSELSENISNQIKKLI